MSLHDLGLRTLSDVTAFRVRLAEELRDHFPDQEAFGILLSVEEAIVNAVKHGNQLDPNKQVRVTYSLTKGKFEMTVEDEGPGFNPADVPDPLDPENLERPGGRGLLLMRSYLTEVEYSPRGNRVRLLKTLDEPVLA